MDARQSAPVGPDRALRADRLRGAGGWVMVGSMRIKLLALASGLLLFSWQPAWADVLEMQNGDRYTGKVLSVSAETVVLDNEILGKIDVPRNKVVTVTFGNAAAARPAAVAWPTNLPSIVVPAAASTTNADLGAALHGLGGDTNFIAQIRRQMLAGSPEAAAKYDETVNGLLSGQLNLGDLRKQAQASAQQLRELKRELGPDADESLDAYLKILDAFVNESAGAAPK